MMPRDSLAFRTLLAVARQRNGIDETRCGLLLEFLSTADAVHVALHHDLAAIKLTELKLGVLVVLFALDPSPSTPADLAAHTGATRSAITDVLDQLEAGNLLQRQRDTADRRMIYVRLTDTGRTSADGALNHYLESVGRAARFIPFEFEPQLHALFAALGQGTTPHPLPTSPAA